MNPHTVELELVTIIAEAVIEERVLAMIQECGARGWTVSDARGAGSRGMRASAVEGTNVRIESVVGREVSARILDCLAQDWFPHYAVVAWVEKVRVVRGDKYAG